jgi:hypothetical protein
MLEKQLRDLIDRYLAQGDQASFAQGFARLYFQARNDRNVSREARQICDSLVLPFAELSRGHRTESSFREVLTRIASPFSDRPKLYILVGPQDLEMSFGVTRKPPQGEWAFGSVDERMVAYHA